MRWIEIKSKKYNEKIKNLLKLNKHYYDLNKPLVNDYEYDQIKTEILSLEKKHNFLTSQNSPSKIVGFKPSKTFKRFFIEFPCFHFQMLLMRKI